MTLKGLVIFDGDDTLWSVEPLYDAALLEARRLIDTSGLPGEEWQLLQRAYDLRNVEKLGMSTERFPLSSRQALVELGRRHGQIVPASLIGEVDAISRSVFQQRAQLAPMASEVLTALEPAFRLVLLTKGDPRVQQRRVDDSGLSTHFERIEIVPEKNETVFKELVSGFQLGPENAWSVGNSLASDVNLALRAGLNAVWIDAYVWEHERREVEAVHPRVVVLDRLAQLPEVLLGMQVHDA
jgi:putative hydrolase of the HAD superfamily